MPLVDGEDVSPEDAMAKGLCPECGEDLKVRNPIGHRKTHWLVTPPLDTRGDEARKRMALFDQFILDNKVRTSNMPKPKESGAIPVP